MKFATVAAVLTLVFSGSVAAQGSVTTSGTSVPTGTPIPGNYSGSLRPQVHFSPPQNFMNDPNGCFIDANNTWHLYYQYNPVGLVAGSQHWGHATSQDLYHWENQQIAIFPPNDDSQIFTGSVVVDVNNTSGFFPNQDNGVVAIYTLNTPTKEVQEIAYSRDGGYTFTAFEGNPVIDSNSTNFRDPKVMWYDDHWVMSVAYAREFTIGFYTSIDLKSWSHVSNFSHPGPAEAQYECPNLVRAQVSGTNRTMFLLMIGINPGAPLGGSIDEYFIGDFNGTHFLPVLDGPIVADFAMDSYAGQFFYGTGPETAAQGPVVINWASNWDYAQSTPAANEGWRSSMSIPRRNYIANSTAHGYSIVSEPFNVDAVLAEELACNESLVNAMLTIDYSSVASNAIFWEVNVSAAAAGTLNLTFSSPVSNESLWCAALFCEGNVSFVLNRENTHGFNNTAFTPSSFNITASLDAYGAWSARGLFDRSMLEVFLNGGVQDATTTFFPVEPLTTLVVRTDDMSDGANVSLRVLAVKSAWAQYEDANGIVVGNVTAGTR